MPRKTSIVLPMPSGGLYKRRAYHAQPVNTTPDCLNVRPDGAVSGRERIGSQPGLSSPFGNPGGGAVRLLGSVRWQPSTGGAWSDSAFCVIGSTVYMNTDSAASWSNVGSISTSSGQLTGVDHRGSFYIADSVVGGLSQTVKQILPASATSATIIDLAGTKVPKDCLIILRYRDRLVLTGDLYNPHQWYMSRSGDPKIWDDTIEGVLEAVSGKIGSAGQPGEPIRAAISHGDDCVIFGCDRSVYTLRSDPGTSGGTMDLLSNRIGIIDKNAWCRSSEGWLYFLTQSGVMAMQPGCGDTPISLSRERMPEELLFTDSTAFTTSMAYDERFRGILLAIADDSGSTGTHWWIDVKQSETDDREPFGSFWPFTPSPEFTSMAVWEEAGGANQGDVLIGDESGNVKVFDASASGAASSYIDLGPFSTTQKDFSDGSLDQLDVIMATGSNSAQYEIRTGESPEDCFDSTVIRHKRTWDRTHNTNRLRLRGSYFIIRVKPNSSDQEWAIEEIRATMHQRGKKRFSWA